MQLTQVVGGVYALLVVTCGGICWAIKNYFEHETQNRLAHVNSLTDANVRKIRALQPAVVKRYRQSLHDRIERAGVDLPLDDKVPPSEVPPDRVDLEDCSNISRELSAVAQVLGYAKGES